MSANSGGEIKVIILGVLAAVFISVASAGASRLPWSKIFPAPQPAIRFAPASFDFGDVSQAKGVTTTEFAISNNGKADLIINKLATSCGCTTAALVKNGVEGPKFGMPGHGMNESVNANWKFVIAPGEKAVLRIYYDPNVHQTFRGTARRVVTVYSNDKKNYDNRVFIDLNQVD